MPGRPPTLLDAGIQAPSSGRLDHRLRNIAVDKTWLHQFVVAFSVRAITAGSSAVLRTLGQKTRFGQSVATQERYAAIPHAEIPMIGPRLECFKACVPSKLVHLYAFCPTVTLNERFDPGRYRSDSLACSSQELLVTIYMKGPVAYIGGKNRIANQIIAIFPEHKTYIEVFAGGAQVLFHKQPSPVEIINDLDGDVVTFFRVCQLHYQELVRFLKYLLTSREWFDLLQAQDPKTLTDVQRAARFFYLQKNAYAGLVRKRKFGYSVEEPTRFNPESIPELIEKTHQRLVHVQIEHLPYEDVLKRYDRPTSLFYLDPPYFGRKLYNFNFSEPDFAQLAERLGKVKGKFVLSLNDVPEVRRIFRSFYIRQIELAYTAQQTAGKRFRELLITNYKTHEAAQ
jgi:DNA adenine methylase